MQVTFDLLIFDLEHRIFIMAFKKSSSLTYRFLEMGVTYGASLSD